SDLRRPREPGPAPGRSLDQDRLLRHRGRLLRPRGFLPRSDGEGFHRRIGRLRLRRRRLRRPLEGPAEGVHLLPALLPLRSPADVGRVLSPGQLIWQCATVVAAAVLYVKNLDRMGAFYEAAFGLTVVETAPGHCVLVSPALELSLVKMPPGLAAR